MVKLNPRITQHFAATLAAHHSPYTVQLKLFGQPIELEVLPSVFPPGSEQHSISSALVHQNLGSLTGKTVLDLGCGCGVESIAAILAGAQSVDGVDINPVAVLCSQTNTAIGAIGDRVKFWQSDLFNEVPLVAYDLIIANLPIVDYRPDAAIPAMIATALYDPDWALHHRLLDQAKRGYLKPGGLITFTHANLQSRYSEQPLADFERLEQLIAGYGYRIIKKIERNWLDYRWINYSIRP